MKEETISLLKKYKQEKLFNYFSLLNKKEKEELEKQIERINFEQLNNLYQSIKQKPIIEEKRIEAISYVDKAKLSKEEQQELEKKGIEIIQTGKYAVVTMAGGQGTRLGHKGPKGTYLLNTVNGPKYIFEIIIDTLKKANEKYGIMIPWYVMTSRENNEETIEFLEQHSYFGYDKTKVKFFKQGELPLLNEQGELILDKDKKIKEAADGNGGIYEAMLKNGVLQDMKQRGIEWIFVSNVDNILSHFVDPLLLGLTIKQNNLIATKSVEKTNPKEKVGVFCKMNGKAKVIEYIDLPEERDFNGELIYGEVNIANYLFHRSVFEELENSKLPYHAAHKKSGYLTDKGEYVEPNEPNAYKFESFIFDAFVKYDNMTVLRVRREEEFAPVKNKEGNDSPETATELYNNMMKKSN